MGKNNKQLMIDLFQEDKSSEENFEEIKIRDPANIVIGYTSRRQIQKTSSHCNKTIGERKIENDQEFEELCCHIQECSISKRGKKGLKSSEKSDLTSSSGTSDLSSTSENSELETGSISLSSESIEEFRKYVQAYGHYGGWKVKDHLSFVKIRSKFPLNRTAEKVHEEFPDISIETVLQHDTWYTQYCKLRNANKIAIEEWKKVQKQPVKEGKQEENPKCKSATIKRDPNIKEKIEIWKAKTLAANLERLKEQQQKEILKKREEENRKKLHEEKKMLLNRYLEEKLNYEMAMKAAEEVANEQAKKEAAQKTAILLKYFRHEDRRFSERQKSKRKQQVKEEPKPKTVVQVKRDPSRLLRPTQGWIYHTKKNEQESQVNKTNTLYINHVPKLGKPAWRKPITLSL